MFLVDGPVTYLCDTVAGTLLRYQGYTVEANQSANDSHGELLANGATASLMANQVASCAFTYAAGHCGARRARVVANHRARTRRIRVAAVAGSRGQRAMTRARSRQGGFSLVSAIFLLVVLAGLGAYAVRLNTLQQQTVTAGLRAAQAFEAARTGAAWGAYQALNAGVCGTSTLNLTEGALAGFSVAVQCTQTMHTEGTATVRVFVFDVRAQAGAYGGPDYVSRRLQTKVTDAV